MLETASLKDRRAHRFSPPFLSGIYLPQEPAKKQYGAAAADRTPTLKSVTVSPNTKSKNRANPLSQSALSLASVKCMN